MFSKAKLHTLALRQGEVLSWESWPPLLQAEAIPHHLQSLQMLQRLLLLHPGLTMKVQSHVRSFWMPAAGSRDLCFSLAHSDISTLHSTFPTKLKKPFSLLTPSIPLHAYSTAELLTVRACMADTNTHTHTQTHTHTPHQFTHAPLCLGALMWLTLLPTPLAGSIQCQRHLP